MRPLSDGQNRSAPISGVGEWRERLLAMSCYASAALLLIAPFIHWVFVGQPPNVIGLAVATGLLLLALPLINVLSVTQRSWFYCVSLTIVIGTTALIYGFSPIFVGGYNLLLLTAGLLIGRSAMVLVTILGVGGLVWGGIAVDAGLIAIDTSGRDPGNMRNWYRVTALFGLLSLTVIAVVRFATNAVNDQYTRVKRELAHAVQLRAAAEQAREARLSREKELRSAQKLQAVAALSGGLAHLFNNALTVVQSVLESLQKNSSMESRTRARARLGKAMEPAVRATQDLMIFSRREVPDAQSIALGPFVADFAESFGQTMPEDVNLRISTSPGLTVKMDPDSLKQLILNLVLNAVDAVNTPGKVRITVAPFMEAQESDVRWAVIAVEDDGSGMDGAMMKKALDPFYTSKDKHSGLGLTVANAIAAQTGGGLRLESSTGVGTRALAILPLEVAQEHDDPESLWPTASALHGRGRLSTTDVLNIDEDWSDEPPPEPAWQGEITRRLGRIAATIIFVLAVVVGLLVPHMRPLLLVVGPISVGLMAAAGWARFLSPPYARACLIIGFWLIGAAVVFRASFDNMAGMSIILIATAWAGLLGRRWEGLAAVAITTVTFLVVGALRSGPIYYPPASNSDMNIAANWFRFAPQLGLYSLALSTSVLAALAAANRGARSEQDALDRIEEMRKREAEEGARLLALETSGTRSERAEAAGQAAGTVAHDLMNAVQSLMGAVEVLAVEQGTEDRLDELLAGLAHAAGYAEALTTQFESISPTPGVGDHFPDCDVSSMTTNMVGLMRRVLPDRIELVSNIEPELVVRISETDLRRLVFNLISNARDAIAGTGTITVSLASHDGKNALCVNDTGCGIDDVTRAKMFDPFFSTKERGQGTGLGLHSVEDVVVRTQGSIEVESKVGAGSSFTVSWPAGSRQSAAHDTMTEESAPTTEQGGIILLAEDEPLVRKIMAETLHDAGYDVVEAIDGDEGKRLALENTRYVAACIDGVMPGAPSSEVIESFQQTHPGCPVLLCSGYMPADLANRGLLTPGVILLAKPFTPTRLLQELKAATGKSVTPD